MFSSKCTKKRLAAGLRPEPLGQLKRSPEPLVAIRGPTSKGRGDRERRERGGREENEKEGGEGKEGREGRWERGKRRGRKERSHCSCFTKAPLQGSEFCRIFSKCINSTSGVNSSPEMDSATLILCKTSAFASSPTFNATLNELVNRS